MFLRQALNDISEVTYCQAFEYGPFDSVNVAAAGSTRIFVIFRMISCENPIMQFYSGRTSFHDFPGNVCVETVAQCHFPLNIALNCGERLKPFRNVVTFFRLDLLHDLATIEGSKFLFIGH